MKTGVYAVFFLSALCVPSAATAQSASAEVISPHEGGIYPRAAPTEGNGGFHLPISLASRCFDQRYKVAWGVDNETLGEASFVDQGTIQFTHKLPEGIHVVWIRSDCAKAEAKIKIR